MTMNAITIVIWLVFQFINIMIDMQSLSIVNVRLPLYSDFIKFCHIFYKILYEITI